MKKLYLLLTFFALLSLHLQGQTILSENFDGDYPEGWISQDTIGSGSTSWSVIGLPDDNGSYNYCMMSSSWGSYEYANNWLITPSVSLPENAMLSFKLKAHNDYGSYYGQFSVFVSVNYGPWEPLFDTWYLPDDYEELYFSLSAYANQDVRIGFKNYAPYGSYGGVAIDDVNIREACELAVEYWVDPSSPLKEGEWLGIYTGENYEGISFGGVSSWDFYENYYQNYSNHVTASVQVPRDVPLYFIWHDPDTLNHGSWLTIFDPSDQRVVFSGNREGQVATYTTNCGATCTPNDQCPLYVHLERTVGVSNDNYTVSVMLEGMYQGEIILSPEQSSLDTTLMFCPNRSVQLNSGWAGDDFICTVTDAFGKTTALNVWDEYHWEQINTYVTGNVCAEQCVLMLDFGSTRTFQSVNQYEPWLAIYAGDSYMPYMEFYQSDWYENSYRNVSIPVSVNVPLRFVWHDPDPENHSVWFSVYDTIAQLQVCSKEAGVTLADGQIATYTPTCSTGCVTEEQCPMQIHISRENSNEGISVVRYYGGGVENGEFILTSERSYVDTTLMLCEGRPFGMYTEQGGDYMWGYILDAHGNENYFSGGWIDYNTPDPCAQHCMLEIEIGAAEALSNIAEPHWLRIYAGEEELPASLFDFNYSRWNYAGDRYWYQIPLTGSSDTLKFVWTEPDPTNHSSTLVIYDMKSGRQLLRKDEYTSLDNGVVLEHVSTCELDPVYTMNVYEVEVVSARVGMSVNSEGFENYNYNEEVSYGICWGTSTNPVVDQDSSLMRSIYEMGSQYFDEFELDNLTPNTTYFVRAFAIYQNELFYGNELSFTTKPCFRLTESYESVCDTFVMRLESQLMSEGFENGFPSGWTTVNVDGDSYNWNSYSGWSHTGSSSIYSYAYNSAQDNYLITPAIEVPADGQTSFSWWALKNSSASPHYEVYVSTSPDIADFGESVFSEEPGYGVFQQYSIDLDNWAGQTVYVAFRHNSTWYTYGVYLDDIEVKHSVVADILTESGDYVFTNPNEYGCVDTILLHLTVRDNKPDVTTLEVNHIGVVSAIAHGQFGQDCGNPVTESGICFSTTHNPTIQNNRVVNNEGVEYFELPLNGLDEGTTYYVRAYATNSAGTMYGEEVSFTTLLWASLNGTVYNGTTHEPVPGAYVSIYNRGNNNSGFVTTVMADENGHYSVEGLTTEYYSVIATASGYNSYGVYPTLIAGANTVDVNIYYRSCLTPTDLSYELIPGEQGTDLRLSWEMGGNIIKRCSSTQYNGAYGLGSNYSVGVYHLFTPEYLAYYNGGAISSIGTWFTDDAEYATYTLRIWTGGTEENGPTTLAYEQVVNPAGIALNAWNDIILNTPFAFDGTQNLWIGFQVVCNAPSGNSVNAIGVTDSRYVYNSYGNVLFMDNQWNTHSGLNYNWMIRATVVPNGLTYNVLANGQLVASNVTNTHYLVSPYIPQTEGVCYQVVTNCVNGRTSDTSACATVLQTLPAVATLNVSNITSNYATISGELLSDGNAEVTERGFCWSTMAHPTTRDGYTSVGENFMATIYLQPQTTYYVRAYATNSIGTGYGNEIEFTTRTECIAPSMLTVSDVVASSALVTWQGGNNNPFMSYELSYKAADATDWTVVSNIQDEYYMLTGLQQNTAYTVRVSAKCEEDNVSPYVEKSFNTACVAVSMSTTIGEGTGTTSGNILPIDLYYKYAYTQQIYLASEIGGARTINDIGVQYFYSNTYTRNVDIYLLHTSKNAFSSNNDWVSVAGELPVFSGYVTFNNSNEDNWVNIPLTTPFEYNGSDNLVLVFNDKTGSYVYNGPTFYTHDVSAYRSLYAVRDGSVFDPINPVSGSRSTSCNNFRIPGVCISEGCDRANVVVREVTDSSATLILAAAGTNDFELQYAEVGNENYTTIENVTQGTSYVLNNLRQNTSYKVRIRSNCGNEENSEWKTATFTTSVKNMERLYVTSNGAGDGSSWTNAVNDPNWALNTANLIYQTYGTMPEIWVAEGTYYGATDANSSDAFTIRAGQKLYGGFAGTENSLEERDIQAHPVILDGQNSRRVLYQSTYNYNNSVVIDGFTIRNGYAGGSGGGAYLNSKFEVRNCDFINNTSSYSGGAVYVAGSGVSNIYNFSNCRFIGNNASSSGGAVYDNYDYSCYINCKFSGNYASNYGGALYSGRKLVNCEVSHNTANGCSGLYSISDTLINCDIVGNTSNNGYAALMYLQGVMINTVVWGNSSNGIPMNISDYSNMTAINSAVEGGLENNENVINLQHDNYGFESGLYYPMFASPEIGDYRLRAGSALIDAGLNEVEMADSDMAGGSRVYDNGTIDVGCYEFHGEEFCSEPYGLEVQNVTGTTALISWHNGNPTTPDHYQIAYRQEGENNWTELTDEISTDYYVLTNLLQQTNYQVKVRAFCNTTNSSEYSVPVTFTTNCSGNYFEELTIGTSTSTTSYVPICPSYKYSYSQQIYLAEEIGDARIIDTLCVQYPSSTVMTRNVDVYMGYTTKTNFSDSYDWIPSSDLTQVYSGEITFTNEGENYWLAIPVNNFDYNGSGNLVIAFYDHTGSTASSASFYYHSTPDYRTMYRRGSYEVDMTNLGYAYTMYYSCINIRFPKVCTPSSCDRPSITINDITDSSAVVILATSAENLEVEYGIVGSSEPYTTLPTGSLTIQLNNLKQNTKYEVRGRSVCGANENSVWTKVYFTTPAKNLSRLYVNVAGTGDASSWAEASNDLEWTLDLAVAIKEQFGKTPDIWVAKGTYYGDGTSNNAFTMMDGVNVFGGFYGNEADDYDLSLRDFTENASVLDGQNIQRVLYQPSAFNDQTVWDGFTIQQGNVSNFSSNSNGNCGGGAFLRGKGVLRNCRIINNAAYMGGGVYSYASYSYASGAALEACTVSHNTASYVGAGVYLYYSSLNQCEVSYNTGSGNGAGVYVSYVNSDRDVISNCLVANNTSNNDGAGIYAESRITVLNSTIVNNKNNSSYSAAAVYGGYDQSLIENSIVWGNRNNSGVANLGGGCVCQYSAVEGLPNGTDNIVLSSENDGMNSLYCPRFVNPLATAGSADVTDNVDWHLAENSVCINRGSNDLALAADSVDMEGNARVQMQIVDLGCYESPYNGVTLPEYNGIVYVKENGSGTRDGSSWANAMPSLTEALSLAYMNDADVWVAKGTYYGDSVSSSAFYMVEGVDVYGGFFGNEPADYDLSLRNFTENASVLDGQNNQRVLYQRGHFTTRTVWDGFTMQNGYTYSDYNNSNDDRAYGGGACLKSGSTLSNCLITQNRATSYGGGVYVEGYYYSSYDTTRLLNCTVSHNTSEYYGGGMYLNNRVIANQCRIEYNFSREEGGGAYLNNYVYVINCLIANNSASGSGAGVYASSANVIKNTTIVNNDIRSESGDEFYYNRGAAVYVEYENVYITNCIVWGNKRYGKTNGIHLNSTVSHVTYVAIDDVCAGENNIMLKPENDNISASSPHFVKPSVMVGYDDTTSNVNWHLQQGSPCINHGDNSVADVYDLDGNARVQMDTVDMGCYESPYNSIELPKYEGIIYVTQEGGGNFSGDSWTNAMSSVQDAMNFAFMNNAVVWVAAGIYHGNGTSENAFEMKQGVSVYGGFAGDEDANYDLSQRDFESNTSILDGQYRQRVLMQPEVYSDDKAVVWDGFTIQNGRVNGDGAGAYLRGNSTLRNCVVRYNTIVNESSYYSDGKYGAGIYVNNDYSEFITTISYCVITDNGFEYDQNPGYGAGIYSEYTNIDHTEISHNTSPREGAGLYAGYKTQVSNSLIHHNRTSRKAGGVYVYGSECRFINCDMVNNTSSSNGAGVYSEYGDAEFANCIIWGNKKGYLIDNMAGQTVSMSHCAVEEGYDGEGNVTLASANDGSNLSEHYVRFVDPESEDYQLHPASNCIDMGSNDVLTESDTLDFYGNSRIYNSRVDIGCSESQDESSCPSVVNVTVSAVTTNSAHLTWTSNGTETEWVVAYGEVGGDITTATVYDTEYQMEGLRLNRQYMAKVRAVCDDNSMSVFSIPAYFQTSCDPTQLDTLPNFSNLNPSNDVIIYNATVDFSWSSMEHATSYDFYLWKTTDSEPSTPSRSGLTQPGVSAYQVPNYAPGVEYYWKVVAWNECISKTSEVMLLKANKLPDLHVTNVRCSNPRIGQTVTVEWTVKNDGQGNTPPAVDWTDYIWLVHDADVRWYDPNDRRLAEVANLGTLNAGESYTNTYDVTIPTDLNPGNYYLFVFADQPDAYDPDFSHCPGGRAPAVYEPSVTGDPYPYATGNVHFNGVVNETEDHDNFFYIVLTILPPPSPDLQVSSVVSTDNALSGQPANVTWTVINDGEANALGSWTDVVYLSSDTLLDTEEDFRVGRFVHEGGLLLNESYQQSTQFTIPVDYDGDYYFIVMTDYNNNVYEGLAEINNKRVSSPMHVTMSWFTDLVVTAVSVPSDVMDASGEYTCSFTVENQGLNNTNVSRWYDAVYISASPVLNTANAMKLKELIHHGVVRAQDMDNPENSMYSVEFTLRLPDTMSGQRYLHVVTDERNEVFEHSVGSENVAETNNTYTYPHALTVLKSDLVVESITVPDVIDPNEPVRVQWSVRNIGPGNVANRSFQDYFYFNGSRIYEASMTSVNIPVGESIVRSAMVQLPCADGGATQLTITTDVQNTVFEADETNNSRTVALNYITPDLAVNNVTLSHSANDLNVGFWSGAPVELSYTVTNHGSVATQSVNVADEIFFSTSPTSYQTSDLVYTNTHEISLGAEGSETYTCVVNIPNGISGTYYCHVLCNADTALCENGAISDNVAVSQPIEVSLSPSPDLVITQLDAPSEVYIGVPFSLTYTIMNQGTAAINQTVMQKFYYSTSPLVFDTLCLVATSPDYLNIGVNESVVKTAVLTLPTSVRYGEYYIHVVADANDQIYEYEGEQNNNAHSGEILARTYQLDLQLTSIEGPSEMQWGATATYTLHVQNNSSLPALNSLWRDVVYLSTDNVLSTSDRLIQSVRHTGGLEANGEYEATVTVTIPYGTPATAYLIGVVDMDNANPDETPSNNVLAKLLTINSTPTPDLAISEVVVLEDIVAGQPARVAYKVTNESDIAIEDESWNDRLFVSYNNTFENGDVQLLNKPRRNMTLNQGESYRDTLEFTVPMAYNGSLYLLMIANANNDPYEVVTANNIAAVPVSVTLPLPGDLVVTEVSCESRVVSGQMLHATWTIQNIGDNALIGRGLRSLVYVSADTVFDANDRLLGSTTESYVNLGVDETLQQNLTGRISGVAPGNYYLIVKTDVTNAFNEVSDDNNKGCMVDPFVVTIRPLPFNTDVYDTLTNDVVSDYMLSVVGDEVNQTARIHIASEDSLAGAVNMIYATYNGMGNNLNYSYSTIGQYTANTELYIPATQPGYYGVNIYGSTPSNQPQNMIVRADILPFELRAVNDDHGGNTGIVTVELTGSRFRPDMVVSLSHGDEVIVAQSLIYVNYYQVFVEFDLTNHTPGVYDVKAMNFCEGEAVLPNAFTIENGQPSGLAYNLLFPSSPRPNRTVAMMLEYGNIGNVDLHNQVLEITSIGGCPIALTPEELSLQRTTLRLPLSIENEPAGLLRPGSYGTLNIYTYSSSALIFTIKPVEE